MRVLIIPSWYPLHSGGISGSFFKEQAIALAKNGNTVTVANATFASFKYLFNKNKGKVIKQEECGITVYSCNSPSCGRARFPKLGLSIYMKNMKKILAVMQAENKKFDVIHAHSFWCGGVAALELSKILNIPFVVTEHSSGLSLNGYTKSQLAYLQDVYQASSKFICVSNKIKEIVFQICKDNKKLTVIPNMVSGSFVKKDTPKNEFTFISVSNLIPHKEQIFNVRCFIKAFQNNNKVTLKIVGGGPLKSEIEALIKAEHAQNKVFLLGVQSREAVCNELNKANVFTLVSSHEPFGVVYIEALKCGLPLIGAKNGGAQDIIQANNGIIIDVNNEEQLIAAYNSMYTNYAKYDFDKISKDCILKYSDTEITNQINSVYKEIIF